MGYLGGVNLVATKPIEGDWVGMGDEPPLTLGGPQEYAGEGWVGCLDEKVGPPVRLDGVGRRSMGIRRPMWLSYLTTSPRFIH
jgi:hypothetical protein